MRWLHYCFPLYNMQSSHYYVQFIFHLVETIHIHATNHQTIKIQKKNREQVTYTYIFWLITTDYSQFNFYSDGIYKSKHESKAHDIRLYIKSILHLNLMRLQMYACITTRVEHENPNYWCEHVKVATLRKLFVIQLFTVRTSSIVLVFYHFVQSIGEFQG